MSTTRHGKRKDGMTSVTFSCSTEQKAQCVAAAKGERRTLSNWIAVTLERAVVDRGKGAPVVDAEYSALKSMPGTTEARTAAARKRSA